MLTSFQETLSYDKHFEIAECLDFFSLYQLAKTNAYFHALAVQVVKSHIKKYFPYLKDHEDFQSAPFSLFKKEYFHRKVEAARCYLRIEEWLKILTGNFLEIKWQSDEIKMSSYALALVCGHQSKVLSLMDSRGKGIALAFAVEKGQLSNVEILLNPARSYGTLTLEDRVLFAPLLEKAKFTKDVLVPVPLAPEDYEYFPYHAFAHHDYPYQMRTTKYVWEKQDTCDTLSFEDMAFLEAACSGQVEIFKKLLALQNHIQDEIKGLALENAAQNNSPEIVRIIVENFGQHIPLAFKIRAAEVSNPCYKIVFAQMNNEELFIGLFLGELLSRAFQKISQIFHQKKATTLSTLSALSKTATEWVIEPATSLLFSQKMKHTLKPTEEINKVLKALNTKPLPDQSMRS